MLALTLPPFTGFQDVLMVAILGQEVDKMESLLPRAGPVRCKPRLGSEPQGLTQSYCPISLPGRQE